MRYDTWFLLGFPAFFLFGLTGGFATAFIGLVFCWGVALYKYVEYGRNQGEILYPGQKRVSNEDYIHSRGIDECHWLSDEQKVNLAQVDSILKQQVIIYMYRNTPYYMVPTYIGLVAKDYEFWDKSQCLEIASDGKMCWKVTNPQNKEEVVRLYYPKW